MSRQRKSYFHASVNAAVGAACLVFVVGSILINRPPIKPGAVLGQGTTSTTVGARTTTYAITARLTLVGPADAQTSLARVSLSAHLENLSNSTLQVSPGLQMFLDGSDNHVYPMTAQYLTPRQVIGGPLPPKASTDLSLDFELPAGVTPRYFTYEPDAASPPTKLELK
jgi:hypothetical protein